MEPADWPSARTRAIDFGAGKWAAWGTEIDLEGESVMFANTKAFSSFAVPDVQEARAFYTDTLGLEVTELDASIGLLTLHLADGRDTMIYEKPDYTPATYTILNFAVDDVEKAVDELSARGVSFERYEGFEQDEKGIARGDAPEIAWFTDPAGNILAVMAAMEGI